MTLARSTASMLSILLTLVLLGACGQSVEQPDAERPVLDDEEESAPAPTLQWSATAIGYLDTSGGLTPLSAGDSFEVRGSGSDIWYDRDGFFYVFTELSGDGSIKTRLDGLEAPHDWSKAGVMIRESLDPSARNVLLHTSARNGSVLQARETTGGMTNNDGGHDPSVEPNGWMRLTRSGDTLIGELSHDGESWRTFGSYTLDLEQDVLIGLAVTSHRDGEYATARFTDVDVRYEARVPESEPEPDPEPESPSRDGGQPDGWVCSDEPLSPAYDPTFYVATTGDDDNDGRDPDRPFRTLRRAASAVSAGDVVWVREGVYSTNVAFQRSGTSDAPIVFESYPGECAVLDGSGHDTNENVRLDNVRYNVFRNFIVRDSPAQGIHLINASDNLVSHVRVHDSSLSGIQNVGGDRNRFAYFIVHNNYDPQSGGGNADGIGMSSGRDNRIDHCVSYRNSDDGVDAWKSVDTVIERCISFENGFQGGDGNGFKAGGDDVSVNTVVRFSIAFGNKMQGFNYNSGRNETFEHNTAFDNDYYGFIAADAQLRNNLSYANARSDWQDDGGNSQSGNSWNLRIGDPGFLSTDPTSPDFLALSPDSSAVNVGTSIGLPFTGLGPDVGALPLGETIESFLGIPLRTIIDY